VNKPMRLLGVLVLLFAAVAYSDAPAKPPSTEDAQVARLQDAKWAPPKAPGFPPGALASPIAVDPQTGASIGYGKFPPGYALPSHWHSYAEYTVLLSGQARFIVDGKPLDLAPGDYLVIPAKAHHQVTCGAGAECVLITRRAGPTDYQWDKQ
jgi:quercetin dioxygenase-like cupin family protein